MSETCNSENANVNYDISIIGFWEKDNCGMVVDSLDCLYDGMDRGFIPVKSDSTGIKFISINSIHSIEIEYVKPVNNIVAVKDK